MKLHDLRPADGSTHRIKRVGRGHGSGMGKTSTRGANGQGQRSGNSTKTGFEGGQMPLYRRLPKKAHFRMPYRQAWSEINVGDLAKFASGATVNLDSLKEMGLLKKSLDGLRILGNGELSLKLTVQCHHVSAGAREKIEAAGGTVELLRHRRSERLEATEG